MSEEKWASSIVCLYCGGQRFSTQGGDFRIPEKDAKAVAKTRCKRCFGEDVANINNMRRKRPDFLLRADKNARRFRLGKYAKGPSQ